MKIAAKSVDSPDPITTTATPCGVPGLAIITAADPQHPDVPGWMIVHVRSGCSIAWFPIADPEAVLGGAVALGELLSDWRLSGDGIAEEVTCQEVLDAVSRWGGQFWHVDPDLLSPDDLNDVAAVSP